MKYAIVITADLALAGCAGQLEKAKAVQEAAKGAKVQTYGELIDLACKEVMVDTVVRAVEARPELAVALPILCPETIGVFMALANQPRPGSLDINLRLVPAASPESGK